MSEGNGKLDLDAEEIVVKLESGTRKFRLGNADPFRIDVVKAWDRWTELLIQAKRNAEMADEQWQAPYYEFLQQITHDEKIEEKVNRAEAVHFVDVLMDCMGHLKKNMREQRGLAASTDSTPSGASAGSSPSSKPTSPELSPASV